LDTHLPENVLPVLILPVVLMKTLLMSQSFADDGGSSVVGEHSDMLRVSAVIDHIAQCVQFQKAFGKRGPRGEVKVINVHLDEVLSGVDVTKNLPNDAEPMMSHSKKRNKDMPSSQQKRKHQISYLAFRVCCCLCAYISDTTSSRIFAVELSY